MVQSKEVEILKKKGYRFSSFEPTKGMALLNAKDWRKANYRARILKSKRARSRVYGQAWEVWIK